MTIPPPCPPSDVTGCDGDGEESAPLDTRVESLGGDGSSHRSPRTTATVPGVIFAVRPPGGGVATVPKRRIPDIQSPHVVVEVRQIVLLVVEEGLREAGQSARDAPPSRVLSVHEGAPAPNTDVRCVPTAGLYADVLCSEAPDGLPPTHGEIRPAPAL